MATTFKSLSDRAVSTLASGITDGATSLTVATGEGALFPASNFWVSVDAEIMLCSSRSTDVLTVTRAQLGTTGVLHSTADPIALNTVSQHFDDITAAINTAENGIDALQLDEAHHAKYLDAEAVAAVEAAGLSTPALGTPSALVGTNISGTATNLTAGAATLAAGVTTNANLTGHITSSGSNATLLGEFTKAQLSTAVSDGTPLYDGDIVAGASAGFAVAMAIAL